MGGCGKLEPAADHGAMQGRDHRHLAELDALEGAVPQPRMLDALADPALPDLAEVEPGGEVRSLGGEHHRLDAVVEPGEIALDADDRPIIERVALLAAREP